MSKEVPALIMGSSPNMGCQPGIMRKPRWPILLTSEGEQTNTGVRSRSCHVFCNRIFRQGNLVENKILDPQWFRDPLTAPEYRAKYNRRSRRLEKSPFSKGD